MKIQTTAQIEALTIDDTPQEVLSDQTIDLEFSAIDTGGGFKDPMLDFSFRISKNNIVGNVEEGTSDITVVMLNPGQVDNQSSFSCETELHPVGDGHFEINGRLKEQKLSKELIGFVFKLLR